MVFIVIHPSTVKTVDFKFTVLTAETVDNIYNNINVVYLWLKYYYYKITIGIKTIPIKLFLMLKFAA